MNRNFIFIGYTVIYKGYTYLTIQLKVLVPIDGTERNIHALNWLKRFFSKANTEITLINVMDIVVANEMVISNEFEYLGEKSELILDEVIKHLGDANPIPIKKCY